MFFIGKKRLQAIQAEAYKKAVQAMAEGNKKDVLTSAGISTSGGTTKENNYPTYQQQLDSLNEMYNNRSSFGGEMLRTLVDTRASFICGGGLSVFAKNKKIEKWIEAFLKFNKLHGSGLIDNTVTGELEGKCLTLLKVDQKNNQIKTLRVSARNNAYEIKHNENIDDHVSATVTMGQNEPKVFSSDRFVYTKLGGSPDRVNDTPSRLANILTDIENFSRAKYDMRQNNHLFGRVTPYFKTPNSEAAAALRKAISESNWQMGKSYAGESEFSLVEPGGKASDVIINEMIMYARIISVNTGIPLQWLAFPDLLSNRATADNMTEAISASTIQERTRWEEAYTEIIKKSMQMAQAAKLEGWVNSDEFEIRLPFISYSQLKQIQETWLLLAEEEYISRATVRNMLPGINPVSEVKEIEKERKEKIENSPFQTMVETEIQNDPAEN